ncbi:MAG: tRNA pseudouridine(38-40) synthase TruA [Chloroflexota bacterium]
MTRYRATLAYDGTAYNGYQIQPNVPTIQGIVEDAIEDLFGQPTRITGAGRTDTGVHAMGQVIAFDVEWKHSDQALLKAINVRLPHDIALQDITQQDDFHPRYDALSRTYRYHIAVVEVRQPLLIKRAWQMQQKLEIDVLQAVADLLIGEHDFATFGNPPQGDNTVRTVFRSTWTQERLSDGNHLFYEVEATAFLHHMVRRLVGLQVAIGIGKINFAQFEDIFHSCNLDRNKWIAPPYGLTLINVTYPPAGMSREDYQKTQEQSI